MIFNILFGVLTQLFLILRQTLHNACAIEPNIGTESRVKVLLSPHFFIFKVKLKISLALKWILRRIPSRQANAKLKWLVFL